MEKELSSSRKDKNKELLIEQLKKTPIIQIVCEKLNIARSTFYRWKNDDAQFSKNVDNAIIEGNQLINDLAESKLISAIKDQNMTGIIFWLKNHHKTYADKLELRGKIKTEINNLTPEQEELITKALELSSLVEKKNSSDNNLSNNN
ncbi:hypothetical protein KAJ41_01130 [Candidatus Parcubacteria bacterium]|nr:hypothetical protein [Candidatus Parcubacteria bacterium]